MIKSIKILHISSAISWRGGEQQIANLVEGLKIVNKEVKQIVFCAKNSAIENYLEENNINFISEKKRSAVSFFFIKSLYKCIKTFEPDIIHIHDSHAHTACVIAHFLGKFKTPIVLHRRVDFKVKRSFFSNFKYKYNYIKKVISVSEAIKNIIHPNVKAPIEVIYSSWRRASISIAGVIDLKKELGISESSKLVGNISALVDHKDYPTFIKTASKIITLYSDIHFVIVGEGELRETIEKKIKSLGLDNKIHLLGFRKDIVEIMKSLDIFFMPSKMEGLGSIIYTAFGCRIPVVATNTGGIPELIKHNSTGYLADTGDYSTLSNLILEVLENKRPLITENAHKLALENLYVNMAESTYKVYLDLLDYKN